MFCRRCSSGQCGAGCDDGCWYEDSTARNMLAGGTVLIIASFHMRIPNALSISLLLVGLRSAL